MVVSMALRNATANDVCACNLTSHSVQLHVFVLTFGVQYVYMYYSACKFTTDSCSADLPGTTLYTYIVSCDFLFVRVHYFTITTQ